VRTIGELRPGRCSVGPRHRRPGIIYERTLSAASRPVTGYAADVSTILDGEDTMDIWADHAIEWRSICPRPSCGTVRVLSAGELRRRVVDAGSIFPYVKLPEPSP